MSKKNFEGLKRNKMGRKTRNAQRKTPYVGGQALLEGVMIKAGNTVVGAVRKGKRIVTKKFRHASATQKHWFWALPLVRGCVVLYEMMVLGIKMLTWSADVQAEKKEDRLTRTETTLTITLSLMLGLLLFVVIPYYLARFLRTEHDVWFNLIDGGFRVAVFLAYLFVIGLFKDVKRMFEYHGAEHMSVHCHEKNKKLTVDNVRKFSPIHPRCGTALLVFVIIISILAFSLIQTPLWYANIALRIALVPVIAGVAYELLKLSARHPNPVLSLLLLPGLWAQLLTTRKPDKKQIQVAIAAVKKAV